jgi:hypothetical protein
MSSASVVVVNPKKKQVATPPPVQTNCIDAVTPFVRATVAGTVVASWCAGVLAGLGWKLLRPLVFALVTVGGFVFGICLWAAAVVGLLAVVGWITRKD